MGFLSILVLSFLLVLGLYILAGIIPFIPGIKKGLGLFVYEENRIGTTLRRISNHLNECRVEEKKKREILRSIMNEKPPVSYDAINNARIDLHFVEKAIRLNEKRLNRAIGVAFILGEGDAAKYYIEK